MIRSDQGLCPCHMERCVSAENLKKTIEFRVLVVLAVPTDGPTDGLNKKWAVVSRARSWYELTKLVSSKDLKVVSTLLNATNKCLIAQFVKSSFLQVSIYSSL